MLEYDLENGSYGGLGYRSQRAPLWVVSQGDPGFANIVQFLLFSMGTSGKRGYFTNATDPMDFNFYDTQKYNYDIIEAVDHGDDRVYVVVGQGTETTTASFSVDPGNYGWKFAVTGGELNEGQISAWTSYEFENPIRSGSPSMSEYVREKDVDWDVSFKPDVLQWSQYAVPYTNTQNPIINNALYGTARLNAPKYSEPTTQLDVIWQLAHQPTASAYLKIWVRFVVVVWDLTGGDYTGFDVWNRFSGAWGPPHYFIVDAPSAHYEWKGKKESTGVVATKEQLKADWNHFTEDESSTSFLDHWIPIPPITSADVNLGSFLNPGSTGVVCCKIKYSLCPGYEPPWHEPELIGSDAAARANAAQLSPIPMRGDSLLSLFALYT